MQARLAAVLAVLTLGAFPAADAFGQQLEVHYINVGWGSSVLVKGPDGTTVLLEAGNTGKGTSEVVPYLQSIGITPAVGLDYVIGGHQHCDHLGGLDEVMNAGYDVRQAQYYNGSSYTSSCVTQWNTAAAATTAGAPFPATPGAQILLGNGAKLTFVAVNGSIIGGGSVPVTDENDRSIAVLVQYGGFDYLWASDLGGGSDACTGRSTAQSDVESAIVQAISPGGAQPLISAGGIDVLNVNHHGSESSTNPNWMNYSAPSLAIIPTGAGQTAGWDLPRKDVVEHVLLAQSTACVTAQPALVLQTEEGSPTGSLTSFAGYSVGNIRVVTDGVSTYTVSADGLVNQGPNEVAAAALPRTFTLDDAGGADTELPVTSITAPSGGANVSGTVAVAASATDNVAVTRVEFYLDNVLQATDTASPWTWSWNTLASANGGHTLYTQAYDAAGNRGDSAAVSVTVSNDTTAPTTAITAPANGATVSGSVVVSASASDAVGVTRVEFWLDNILQSTDTTSPYSWTWNSATAANGSHSLSSKAYDAAGNVGTSAAVSVTANNDTTAPTTAVTAPAGGATVSGTAVSVTASASDNVGVTRVEFFLDGVLQSTDTTSPYAWTWNSTTATDGSHSLSSKAYDAAGNVGSSAAVSVTVSNGPPPLDLSNWKLVQASSAITYTIPAGTLVPANGYVIIARNATKAAFEAFWRGGSPLPSNVVYINSGDTAIVINGSEKYTLKNAANTTIDGATIAMASGALQSIQRKDPCLAAGQTASWNVLATSAATPGTGAAAGCAKGMVINEFSDASGTGNYVYEFVELHYDK